MVSVTELIKAPPAVSQPTVQNNKSAFVTFEVNGKGLGCGPGSISKVLIFFLNKTLAALPLL